MAAYTIVIKKSALKEIGALPGRIAASVTEAIDKLADTPRPENCKKLKGSANSYRIRVTDYRIIYTVNDEAITVEVIKVGHRKDVYK